MKTHVLTVCNLRTLPHAMVLRAGLRQYHPEWTLHIGLVDLPRHVPNELIPTELLLHVQRIGLPDFDALTRRYTSSEFTNLTKPFFARHLLASQPELDELIYLAPQTQLFSPLTLLQEKAQSNDIVLTSRIQAVQTGTAERREKQFLNAGTYQSGCWTLRRSASSLAFLDWWSDRLARKGWLDLCRGFGTDQLWLDLVPAYFDTVHILRETGYAVGAWNRHQHELRWENSTYYWGDGPLRTVQWTSDLPIKGISSTQAALWRNLKADYQTNLDAFGYRVLHPLVPAWGLPDPPPEAAAWRRNLAQPFRQLIHLIDTFQPDWMWRQG